MRIAGAARMMALVLTASVSAFAAGSMASSSARAQDAGDVKELVGAWRATGLGPQKSITMTLEIKTDATFRIEMTLDGGDKVSMSGRIKVDTAAEPKRLDLLDVKVKGPDGEEQDLDDRLGIYKLEGDVVTIRAADTRPTTLEGEDAANDPSLVKLTRVKA